MKSNLKAFTPQANPVLKPTDIENTIPCILTGPALIKDAVLYVKPGYVKQAIAKHTQPGQQLIVPKFYNLDAEPDFDPNYVKTVEYKRKPATVELIICLNTGQVFEGRKSIARKYGMTNTLISEHLRGKSTHAKGYAFRFATDEERADYEAGVFEYVGPLVPKKSKGLRPSRW